MADDFAGPSSAETADLERTPDAPDVPKKPADLSPSQVRQRWDDGSRDLTIDRRNYWINLSFFCGSQWIKWDRWRQNVVELDPDSTRVRITVNRIRPNVLTLIGKLTGKPLQFEVQPSDSDDATTQGARLGEAVLEASHDAQKWEMVRRTEVLSSYFGGTAAVGIEWDPSLGETLSVDPESNRIVGTGEVRLTPLSITEFCLEPGIRDPYESGWWIQGVALTRDQAQARYQLDEKPPADSGIGMSPLQYRLMVEAGRAGVEDSCLVLTYYQPPKHDDQGVVATVIGDQFVDGPHPWPFPTDDLNLAVFRQTPVTHRWPGDTILNDAMPLQVGYNQVRSAIIEIIKKAGNPRLLVPDVNADLVDELDDDPAAILLYNGQSNPPTYLVPPPPARGHQLEAERLASEIDDVMNVHDVSRGQVDINRTPAASLALLAEKDDTPLGVFAHEQADGWSRVGELVLQLYAHQVTESRTARVSVDGGSKQSMRWNGEMLEGQTDVQVPLDVTKPFSRVAQEQFARQAWLDKVITSPRDYARLAGRKPDDLIEVMDPDSASAIYENWLMADGQVVIPEDFEDHAVHIAEHNRFRKSNRYRYADPLIRHIIDSHVQAHATMLAQEVAMQVNRAAATPGSEQIPQAHEPQGALMPTPFAQRTPMALPPGGGGGAPRPPGAAGAPAGPPPPPPTPRPGAPM